MATKGRYWLLLWLLFALVVLVWVSARQTSAVVLAGALRDVRAKRLAVEAERTALARRLQMAESRAVLIPRAESLGLREAVDSEIINLQAPPATWR
jgi:hypothetical protein